MSSRATVKRMQADQAGAYRAAVEAIETRLGASLPRFRGVEFCVVDYEKPRDLGQAPYYRRFPGLTAKPYWEASDWPGECRAVLSRFEERYPALVAEFDAAIPRARSGFRGQVTGYFGVVDRWLSYTLVHETGDPSPEAFAAFPELAKLLAELVELDFPCKTYFALMLPGVHLTEHCGGQNIALRMHFALRIPPGDAAIRVGGIERRWENGKTLFFDDTFVHEAWNRTDQDRYILLMRLMHPELSPLERAAYFLIEEAFRGSETVLRMKAEVLAAKAAEGAAAKRTVVSLASTAPSPTASWALDPRMQSPFVSSEVPSVKLLPIGSASPQPVAGAFPRLRTAPSVIGAPLYAAPRPKWLTLPSPLAEGAPLDARTRDV